jgi:uncharacterized protein YgiM (DUF1202 family)
MKGRNMSRTLFFVIMWCGSLAVAYDKVMVVKSDANLRAKPTLTSEVVCHVQQSAMLEAKSLQEDWVEVVPPTNVDFYVFSDYIKDGIVDCAQKLNIRAGPGINFNIVGQLENGEKVVARGTVSEWSRIVPPKNSSLWIHRSLVELLEENKANDNNQNAAPVTTEQEAEKTKQLTFQIAPEGTVSTQNVSEKETGSALKEEITKPAIAAEEPSSSRIKGKKTTQLPPEQDNRLVASQKLAAACQAEVSSEKTSQPGTCIASTPQQAKAIVAVAPQKTVMPPQIQQNTNNPAGLDLVPTETQGETVEVEGYLCRKQYLFRSPGDFRLVVYDAEGSPQTVCYLKGNLAQLKALLDRKMKIYGKKYLIRKQKYPVVIPERIILK